MNYKIIAGTISAPLLGASLIALAFFIGDGREARAVNLVILVLGGSLGWLAGVIVSPYDKSENKVFPKYVAAVSTFASGYLVSKADRVLDALLKPEFIASATGAFRICGGISAIVVAMLITYIYRAYAD
jgi:hypothetical protein